MSKILFLTTYYPFVQATGFQKVSKEFLQNLPTERTAIFCLHPESVRLDHRQVSNPDVKIVINPRKSGKTLQNIATAFLALVRLSPFQVIAHNNKEIRTAIESYCTLNDITEVYIEAIWLIDLIPEMKDVPINLHAHILDSNNLLTSRNWLKKIMLWPYYLLMKQYERKNFSKLNKIFTNSPIVKLLIEKESGKEVYLSKNFYDPQKIKNYQATFSKKVLLVGDFSYRPNMDALMNLLSILTKSPELQFEYEFCVVGRLKNIDRFRKKYPLVKFLDFVEDLYSEMSKYCVSLCPLNYASGAKIKIIESMRMGIPVITTQECIDASGCIDGCGVLAYRSNKEFVKSLKSLLDDHIFWSKQSVLATEHAKRNFE